MSDPASDIFHDHPDLARVKAAFPDARFKVSEFRGQATLIVTRDKAHEVLRFLGTVTVVAVMSSWPLSQLVAHVRG